MTGLLLMLRALAAYRSVLVDSSKLLSAGETQAIMTVLELPPRLSCNPRCYTMSFYSALPSAMLGCW